jgi:hypothetical protein
VAEGIGIHDQIVQEGTGRALIFALDDLLAEAAVLGDMGHEVSVIAFDPVVVRKLLANLTTP